MPQTTDQTGRSFYVPDYPERIISLVPSQTELLHDLGLESRVVGITKFCAHPAHFKAEKAIVGGTKILKHKVISELNPDLIIANKEENNRADVLQLSENFPVWVSDINSLSDALAMIISIGKLTQTDSIAQQLSENIETEFEKIVPLQGLRVLYLIWQKPYMAAGTGTFINDMLLQCGLQNVLEQPRYPELREADIVALQPDVILFSSEPYPFKEHQTITLQKLLPHAKMQLVNGEPFSWYGSRLAQSPAYFNKLIDILRTNHST